MASGAVGDLTEWQRPASDPGGAALLALALGVRPLTAQLLMNRHMIDPEVARRFLAPRLADLRPPDGGAAGASRAMAGFARAAARLERALSDGETIGVFGDYDVDGLTTCALLTRFLADAGGKVVPRVARRNAGYGFGVSDADAFADAGCKVVVTGDCGTSDREALAHSRTRGVDVIVVDHHQVPEGDPGAYALINPHQPECAFPFKGLASVGVAFYLCATLRTRLRARGQAAPDPRQLLDLVAIGTVADMAPLTDENRILVAAGLRELGRGARPGLRAMAAHAGIALDRPLCAADIGFKLGPRLNAPGRLGDAQPALDVLLATDELDAIDRARVCEDANLRRRVVQDEIYAAALAQVEAIPGGPVAAIVVAGDGWLPGVVGIVAAKLVERYQLPALAIALDGASGRGSARSAGGVNLFAALGRCKEHLERFGGHAAAAGITIARDALPAFTAAFVEVARAAQQGRAAAAGLPVEADVELGQIDERQVDELERLGPFGMGNPEPLFAARGLAVSSSRVVGQRHLMLTFRDGPEAREAIAFGFAERDPGAGARVRAAFIPEVDRYRGVRRLRLRVRGLVAEPLG